MLEHFVRRGQVRLVNAMLDHVRSVYVVKL
jgi:hypothetical protein